MAWCSQVQDNPHVWSMLYPSLSHVFSIEIAMFIAMERDVLQEPSGISPTENEPVAKVEFSVRCSSMLEMICRQVRSAEQSHIPLGAAPMTAVDDIRGLCNPSQIPSEPNKLKLDPIITVGCSTFHL